MNIDIPGPIGKFNANHTPSNIVQPIKKHIE